MEKEDEENVSRSFRIPRYQMEYLMSLNENQSEALRRVLDKIILDEKKQKQNLQREQTNIYLIITCFGFIFMFFSYSADNIFVAILSALLGGGLIIYCLITILSYYIKKKEVDYGVQIYSKTTD